MKELDSYTLTYELHESDPYETGVKKPKKSIPPSWRIEFRSLNWLGRHAKEFLRLLLEEFNTGKGPKSANRRNKK